LAFLFSAEPRAARASGPFCPCHGRSQQSPSRTGSPTVSPLFSRKVGQAGRSGTGTFCDRSARYTCVAETASPSPSLPGLVRKPATGDFCAGPMDRKEVGGERGAGASCRWPSARERSVSAGSAPPSAADTCPGREDRPDVTDSSAGSRPARCSFATDARRVGARVQGPGATRHLNGSEVPHSRPSAPRAGISRGLAPRGECKAHRQGGGRTLWSGAPAATGSCRPGAVTRKCGNRELAKPSTRTPAHRWAVAALGTDLRYHPPPTGPGP
jgi:hypothetical protein